MKALGVSLLDAADVFRAQAGQLVSVCRGLGDLELLDPSRCRGWSRLDLVTHVRIGLDEMAATAVVQVDEMSVTHDAASYWVSHPDNRDVDPVAHILWLRRTASAYSAPRRAVDHLADAAHRACAAVEAMRQGRRVSFQENVMEVGDFVATWVVELAVHQLDLDVGSWPAGSALARRTLEAIAEAELPAELTDTDAVLVGLGRLPWPSGIEQPETFPVSL